LELCPGQKPVDARFDRINTSTKVNQSHLKSTTFSLGAAGIKKITMDLDPSHSLCIRNRTPVRVNSPLVLNFPWRNGCILETGSLADWVDDSAPPGVDDEILHMALVLVDSSDTVYS
jgi:hypothetical protein